MLKGEIKVLATKKFNDLIFSEKLEMNKIGTLSPSQRHVSKMQRPSAHPNCQSWHWFESQFFSSSPPGQSLQQEKQMTFRNLTDNPIFHS
jgi:hypothetical protein